MSWTDEKVNKLKNLWGKGQTASQIAEILGGVSRNAVIGKAHRLNLSAKIKTRSTVSQNIVGTSKSNNSLTKGSRKQRFRSLLLDKNFEPARNLKLEELNAVLGQKQIEVINNTINLIEIDKNYDKIKQLQRINIQKSINWCVKHKILHNKNVTQSNIFFQ